MTLSAGFADVVLFLPLNRFDLLGPRLNLVTNENEPEAMSLEMRRSDGSCLDREAIAVANRAYAGEGGIFPEAEALFHERDKWKEWKGRSLEEFFNKKADIAMEAAEAEGKSGISDIGNYFERGTMEHVSFLFVAKNLS